MIPPRGESSHGPKTLVSNLARSGRDSNAIGSDVGSTMV